MNDATHEPYRNLLEFVTRSNLVIQGPRARYFFDLHSKEHHDEMAYLCQMEYARNGKSLVGMIPTSAILSIKPANDGITWDVDAMKRVI